MVRSQPQDRCAKQTEQLPVTDHTGLPDSFPLLDSAHEQQVLRTMFDVSPDAILITDAQRQFLMINPAAERLFGYKEAELTGRSCRLIYATQEQFEQIDFYWRQSDMPQSPRPLALRRKDQSSFTANVSRHPLRDATGSITAFLTIVRDITRQLHDEEELHNNRIRLQQINTIASAMRHGMSIDQVIEVAIAAIAAEFPEYRAGYWSLSESGILHMMQAHEPPQMTPIAGQSLDLNTSPGVFDQLNTGRTLVVDNLDLADLGPCGQKTIALGTQAVIAVPLMQEHRLAGVFTLASNHPHHWTDHEQRTVEQISQYLSICFNGASRQLSQQRVEQALKRSEADLRRLAYQDPLTGLANRTQLLEQLGRALDEQLPNADAFALLFIDFDRFKMINDTMGHEVGDQLLVSIADRLNSELRDLQQHVTSAQGLAARMGGDEFVIVLHGLPQWQQVNHFAEQLQTCLTQPHHLAGQSVVCTASIGIVSVPPGEYQRPEQVVRDADIAMYEAKTTGRSRSAWFDQAMRQRIVERASLESDLRSALIERQFQLYFQPIFSLESGQAVGFETVIRWPDPRRGMVPPHRFLPVVQELGLSVPLGQWVLQEACAHWRRWQPRHGATAPMSLHVNLFSEQLIQKKTAALIAETLRDVDMPPSALMLEIPKTVFARPDADPMQALSQIRQLGVGLAVDNFGFGSNSLTNLHHLPPRQIKLSTSLVHDMQIHIEYAALVQATITLAHSLGMTVVAEGIETEAQLAQLQTLNCDMGQGFYFAHALTSDEAALFVLKHQSLSKSA